MEEYSITRALSELKTLKARYQKELREVQLVAVKHGKNLRSPYSSQKPEDFSKNSLAQIQSIEALEKRIVEIKTKIDQANSTTQVKIGSRTMTIQEALVEKSFLEFKKQRLHQYKSQLITAQREYDSALEENKRRVEKLAQDKAAEKSSEEEISKSIEIAYPIEMIDATKLSERIKLLETEIEDFECNVDFALSEINSITKIEVSD
jgi:uncharacterized small protein (DUF1192 family)